MRKEWKKRERNEGEEKWKKNEIESKKKEKEWSKNRERKKKEIERKKKEKERNKNKERKKKEIERKKELVSKINKFWLMIWAGLSKCEYLLEKPLHYPFSAHDNIFQ